MKYSEFMADESNQHLREGNPSVTCNSLAKTKTSFNCYLKVNQAVALARHILAKAEILLENEMDDGVVRLWNVGEMNEKINCGLNVARKGVKRTKAKPKTKPLKKMPPSPINSVETGIY